MIQLPITAVKMREYPSRNALTNLLPLIMTVAACTQYANSIPESEYASRIVGGWQGVVGGLDESMVLKANGTFVCHLQKTGFIAEMLYPSRPGTVSGTWSIAGAILTLTINAAKNEHLTNDGVSAEIMAFHENDILLRSNGSTSSFRRSKGI